MVKKLLKGISNKKVKVFLLFLLCSFLAWFLSNMSESYESRANFNLNYRNLPDTLFLGNNSSDFLEAKIETSGFRHFYFNVINKKINIDLSQVSYVDGRYKLPEASLKKQIEGQLSQNVSLVDLYRNELYVDLYKVKSKEVPIKAILDIQFEPNYILDGEVTVDPQTVLVKGPANEIDTLRQILTTKIELTNIAADFSKEASLVFPKNMTNSIFSISRTEVSGQVVKFSEKVYEVPIQSINVPEGYSIKTFPNTVSIVCKATIEQLKVISEASFQVVADYKQLNNSSDNVLFLQVIKKPEKSYGTRLLENKVNFVLEKE
ncbi:CdaR family protein [Flagellimonas onchidii]|uniref:CdaR family protein n=1 Tax=Flagellimonas onchidii TaxID=2562684 RepID=UPI0010A5C577|nr:YbbR-like domain-containing protein [Allomuricauda onchidii]